jgi:hypothetical protein
MSLKLVGNVKNETTNIGLQLGKWNFSLLAFGWKLM